MTGSWQEGSSHVVCESTHLTSFAMLVDYSGLVAVSLPLCPVNLHVFIFSDTIYPAMHFYCPLFSFNLSYVFFMYPCCLHHFPCIPPYTLPVMHTFFLLPCSPHDNLRIFAYLPFLHLSIIPSSLAHLPLHSFHLRFCMTGIS